MSDDNDTRYNGWTNYETWAVGMFLDGNYTGEGTYRHVLTIVEAEVIEAEEVAEEECHEPRYKGAVADLLKEFVTTSIGEETDDVASGIAADLLSAALDSVDWFELAEHKIDEIRETATGAI